MGKRKCTYENELIDYVLNNCKTYLKERNTIYLNDIYVLLSKALDGVESKKDLTDSDLVDIRRIRDLIKGL